MCKSEHIEDHDRNAFLPRHKCECKDQLHEVMELLRMKREELLDADDIHWTFIEYTYRLIEKETGYLPF